MNGTAHIDHQILSDAADWFALLRSGQACESDKLRWQQWLRQHPDHLRGWQMVEHIEPVCYTHLTLPTICSV